MKRRDLMIAVRTFRNSGAATITHDDGSIWKLVNPDGFYARRFDPVTVPPKKVFAILKLPKEIYGIGIRAVWWEGSTLYIEPTQGMLPSRWAGVPQIIIALLEPA